jgi:hypothetical protein
MPRQSQMIQQESNYYRMLGVSSDASPEDLEKACMALWYKYRVMQGTPLWTDLSAQIEQIHATLTNPQSRALYNAQVRGEATFSDPAHKPRLRPIKMSLGNAVKANALVGSIGFNQSLHWISIERWSDLANWAGLTFSICIAGAFFLWSLGNVLQAKHGTEPAPDSP